MEPKKTRNTEKQTLVREILSGAKKALSVEDIMGAMPVTVNKTTIYRILDRFSEQGEVHLITDKSGKTYYALCHQCGVSHKIHNHIHFECQTCNEITCLPHTLSIPKLDDFTVHETQILVIGICNKCKE